MKREFWVIVKDTKSDDLGDWLALEEAFCTEADAKKRADRLRECSVAKAVIEAQGEPKPAPTHPGLKQKSLVKDIANAVTPKEIKGGTKRKTGRKGPKPPSSNGGSGS